MNRRQLLQSVLLSGIAKGVGPLQGAEVPRAFPGTPFREYSNCYPEYLSGLAGQFADQRDAEIARLTSPTAIASRQKWVQEKLIEVIGGMPESTPLNARLTKTLRRVGYEVRNYVYESRPRLLVSANLYVPTSGSGPFPAVIFQSGHYWEGKAYPSYQRFCQGLVQLGFVVLAFDPMGQGERINYLDSSGRKSRLPNCDAEHTLPGKQMILFGDTCTRFQLWDAIRSVDFLTSLPFVDPKRLGGTGHSGGGTLSMLLATVEPRLSAVAVCMGNIEDVAARSFRPPGSADDAEQNLIDSCSQGLDRWDLFYPFAPKPMMILPSDRDFYNTYSPLYTRDGWEEFQKLEKVYAATGHENQLKWADTPLPHALAYDSRLLIYQWFQQWLNPGSAEVMREPPVKTETENSLWATNSGSTVRDLKSVTPFVMNRSRKPAPTPASIESLIRCQRPKATLVATKIGQVKSRNVLVEVLEVPTDPHIVIPAWLMIPEQVPKEQSVLLVLDAAGAESLWFTSEVDQILSSDAPFVCAADLRGVGALTPAFSPGAFEYAGWHEQEENYAWVSLMFGRPMLGQRVTDILALLQALRSYPRTAGRPIRIAASGKLTVPALVAAALDRAVEELYLSGGLVSFRNIADSEVFTHPFANFVPKILNHTDLPEIAASIAPRTVCLAGLTDAQGRAMDPAVIRAVYGSALKAGHLQIAANPDWSVRKLLSRSWKRA
jgi:dienelactone hydrolase